MATEEELVHQMAAMTVADASRHSNRMEFPDAAAVFEFEKVACEIMGKNTNYGGSADVRKRRILSFFGVPPLVMAKLWELLMEECGGPWPRQTNKKHLLWALHLMKVYSTETVMASNVGCPDEKHYRRWAWLFIEELTNLEFYVVSE
jgi:hypothetical protein